MKLIKASSLSKLHNKQITSRGAKVDQHKKTRQFRLDVEHNVDAINRLLKEHISVSDDKCRKYYVQILGEESENYAVDVGRALADELANILTRSGYIAEVHYAPSLFRYYLQIRW